MVNGSAFNHFSQPRRIDVVLHIEPQRIAHLVDFGKPLFHAGEEFHHRAEFFKTFSLERNAIGTRFIEHGVHVGENVVGIIFFGEFVAFFPELVNVVADGLNKAEFLHIARCERAIKIVDECYLRSIVSSHSVVIFCKYNLFFSSQQVGYF